MRENEVIPRTNGLGVQNEVRFGVLHDGRSDHSGVPSPFDEDIGDDDVLNVHAHERHHGENHDLRREGEHHVDHAHDEFINRSAEVACQNPHQQSQPNRAGHGEERQEKGRTNTVKHA